MSDPDGSADAQKRQLGWYVGWAEKADRKIIFVRLIEDQKKQKSFAGMRAKQGTLDWLPAQLGNSDHAHGPPRDILARHPRA